MNKKILPRVSWLLKEKNITINLVDVGSRNGVLELADLCRFVEASGFEPNPEEYQKLLSGQTDAFLKAKISSPKYKKINYYPFALSNQNGRQEFFITPGPGACGLKEPNLKELGNIVFKGKRFKKSFAEDIFNNYKKVDVAVKTLGSFAAEQNIHHIDYLKIDVEGSEYEVLEGAKEILKDIGVIKVETCFMAFRKEQKLFSDVDIFLRGNGFDLIHYEVNSNQIGYKKREKPFRYAPIDYFDSYGLPLSADGIYVNRRLIEPDRIIAQAAVLLDKNYIDEALFILEDKAKIQDKEFLNLLKTIQIFGETSGQKIRGFGYFLVDKMSGLMAKILRR